jgi:hypothetical protein
MISVICYLLSFICLLQGGDRQGCREGKHPGGGCQRWNLSSVIYYLSVAGRRKTGLYRRQTPWRRQPTTELLSVIWYLLSVCLVRRQTGLYSVQKANTLEAAANGKVCHLSSDICYLSS